MFSPNNIAKAAVFVILLVIPATIYLYFIAQLKSLPKLGYFGPREAISKTVDGERVTDTLYHEVPEFSFINQNNQVITDNHFKGRVYVADFFFASCQSICPIMSSQLERVQAKYRDNDKLGILSHTVDPESDSVAVLRSLPDRARRHRRRCRRRGGSRNRGDAPPLTDWFDSPGSGAHRAVRWHRVVGRRRGC